MSAEQQEREPDVDLLLAEGEREAMLRASITSYELQHPNPSEWPGIIRGVIDEQKYLLGIIDRLRDALFLLRRTPEALPEQRIEGWAGRFAGSDDYAFSPNSEPQLKHRATLILHERPSTGEGES